MVHIEFIGTTVHLTGSDGTTTTLAYAIPRKGGRGGAAALKYARNCLTLRHRACQDIFATIRQIEGTPASITAVRPTDDHCHPLWPEIEGGIGDEFPGVVVKVVDPQPTAIA